jgi:hypothetical protein
MSSTCAKASKPAPPGRRSSPSSASSAHAAPAHSHGRESPLETRHAPSAAKGAAMNKVHKKEESAPGRRSKPSGRRAAPASRARGQPVSSPAACQDSSVRRPQAFTSAESAAGPGSARTTMSSSCSPGPGRSVTRRSFFQPPGASPGGSTTRPSSTTWLSRRARRRSSPSAAGPTEMRRRKCTKDGTVYLARRPTGAGATIHGAPPPGRYATEGE